jgi:hypothetical protein
MSPESCSPSITRPRKPFRDIGPWTQPLLPWSSWIVTGFHEVQRLRPPPILLLACVLATLTWAAAIDRVVFGHAHGIDPAPTWVIALLWTLFGVGVPLLLTRVALVTDVDEQRLRVGFAPLPERVIPIADIRECHLRPVPPPEGIFHWGIRAEVEGHLAYAIQGGWGVAIQLTSDHIITIGSTRPEELLGVLTTHMAKQGHSVPDRVTTPGNPERFLSAQGVRCEPAQSMISLRDWAPGREVEQRGAARGVEEFDARLSMWH